MASKEVENHQNISKNLKKDKAFNSLRDSMDNKAYYSAKILFASFRSVKFYFSRKGKFYSFQKSLGETSDLLELMMLYGQTFMHVEQLIPFSSQKR